MFFAIYRAIVRRRIVALFDAINVGNPEPVLASFAAHHEHIFLGRHALGGRRTTLPATRRWYERLFRLLPDIHFDIDSIDVRGSPWNTLAIVQWQETNSGTDRVRTRNEGVHIVQLAWGRMTRLQILTDVAELERTLDRLASNGVAEASAPPILDAG
jgi:hypothetical protein